MVLRLIAILLLCGIAGARERQYVMPVGVEGLCASDDCYNPNCTMSDGFSLPKDTDEICGFSDDVDFGDGVNVRGWRGVKVSMVGEDTAFFRLWYSSYYVQDTLRTLVMITGADYWRVLSYNDSLDLAKERYDEVWKQRGREDEYRAKTVESALRRAK